MIKIKKYLIIFSVFLILIVPALSFAQGAPSVLVPCNNTPDPVTGVIAQPCNFNALMVLVNNVINFLLYGMVIPIAAIMFAYAGFELVTAGGESAHARTKAKSIFTNAVIGLVIAIACWLIVHSLLIILGYDGSWIGL
ncbi:MAG: hypothetical protein P4L63_01640 [Candidatus Pacebacteria bacterium]|nr:hypothetical protein [Candidatus Paceibacterota bacterium]